MCTPAATCKLALAEATQRWPGRSRASDGICASPKHTQANPTSDHETGEAFDLTHDPAHGLDAHALADALRLRCESGAEVRVKYIISNSRIAGPQPRDGKPAWAWRPYNGSNPHKKHIHVSIRREARDDTRHWWAWAAPAVPPTTAPAQSVPIATPLENKTMKVTPITVTLDDKGSGYADVPGTAARAWSEVNGYDPAGRGYKPPVDTSTCQVGANVRVIVVGGSPNGKIDVRVFEAGP